MTKTGAGSLVVVSYVFLLLGGVASVVGAWGDASDAGEGANIGAGVLVLAGTGLLAVGLLAGAAAGVIGLAGRARRTGRPVTDG